MDADHCYFCGGDLKHDPSKDLWIECKNHPLCVEQTRSNRYGISMVWIRIDGKPDDMISKSASIVLDIANKSCSLYAIGGSRILHLDFIPPNLTPENAKQKFATYLTFA
jgi:hypothetical protein